MTLEFIELDFNEFLEQYEIQIKLEILLYMHYMNARHPFEITKGALKTKELHNSALYVMVAFKGSKFENAHVDICDDTIQIYETNLNRQYDGVRTLAIWRIDND